MGAKFQFTKGMEVEICSDDQDLRGAWFVGKIIQSIPRKKKALVEYNTLNTSEEEGSKQLKEFVNLINLRPIPPKETHCRFNFSDEVDAYCDDAWWEGIVTRVIEKDRIFRYLVYFRTGKEEIEFGEDELRVHREWVHGNWVPPSEEKAKAQEEASILRESESCSYIDERSKTTAKELVGEKQQFDKTLGRLNRRMEANGLEQNAHSEKKKDYRKRKDQGLIGYEEMNIHSGDCSIVSKRTKTYEEGRRIEDVRVESPKRDSGKDVASVNSLFLVNKGVVDEHGDKNLSIAQIDSALLLNPNLKGHKTLSFIHEKASPIMEDNNDNQLEPVYPITAGESTMESVERPQSLNEVEDSLDFKFTDGQGVLPTLDITRSSPLQQEESPLCLENVSSFVKTSHLWKQIYSSETLKRNPQHPHFRPLENVNEEIREGKAMGLMLIFEQLMETTLRAQIDIPETKLINKLNALTYLEQYGFTVQPLRSRLEKLLKIKTDYILINESFKTAEEELINEKRHFNEMKESISQLNMKLQQLSAEKETKDVKVLELQRKETDVEEKVQHIQVEFDRVVTTFGRNLGY